MADLSAGTAASVGSSGITDDSIVNADVNSAAAIAYSKLNLATSIVNADVSTSAAIAVSKLAPGLAGQVIGGVTPSYAYAPGYEFSYNQITTNVTSTQAVEASADTAITASTVTYDGATTVRVIFSCNALGSNTASVGAHISLWRKDGGAAAAALSRIAMVLPGNSSGGMFSAVHVEYMDTPTAAATIYTARIWCGGATTSSILCTSPYRPAFLRVVAR